MHGFKAAWCRVHGLTDAPTALADVIDLELHRARIDRRRGKVTYRASVGSLPNGSFIRIVDGSYLVWGDSIYRWSFDGYKEKRSRPEKVVEVLTPEPIVGCFREGYRPKVHESALGS